MLDVEADCYWCLSKLLEGIQDHYTYAQPGIQRTVFRVKELVRYDGSKSEELCLAPVVPALKATGCLDKGSTEFAYMSVLHSTAVASVAVEIPTDSVRGSAPVDMYTNASHVICRMPVTAVAGVQPAHPAVCLCFLLQQEQCCRC